MKDAEKTATAMLKGEKVKVRQTIDLDDVTINNIADELAAKTGGGQRTSEVLTDAINEANARAGITNTARESSILRKTLQLGAAFNSRVLTGKVSGVLDTAVDLAPNVVKAFQKKITSSLSSSWKRGESIVRDTNDYGTLFDREFGRNATAWKAVYRPIQEIAKGGYKEEIDVLLSNAIRTNDKKTLATELNKLGLSKDVKKGMYNIVDFARAQLKDMGDEAQGKGLVNNLIGTYLPRLWKRSEIEERSEDFIKLLEENVNWKHQVDLEEVVDKVTGKVRRESLTPRQKAEKLYEEMLDIKYQFGNDSGTGMNSFFARRQLELKDETKFADFLDNDLNNLMVSYHRSHAKAIAKDSVFGVRNVEDFETSWFPALEREMKANGADREQIANAKKNMQAIYQNVTGEGLDRYGGGKWRNLAADGYMLANRVALLPLSTLSSLSEIIINISKAGVGTSYRAFRDAITDGSKQVYDNSLNGLQKSFNMTKKEAMHELNKMGIALDQAFADYADRLGGDALSDPKMREWSNKFFRFTLLDQWTKGVQTVSYITGKRLIAENLESIASHMPLIQAGKTSRRVQRQIDELADLGIDYNEGVAWINKGASMEDDFYRKLQEGAGTYTNEVILNPSAHSGLKPMYMSNPSTSILFQLLGYPAAFTNTVMKNMAKQISRNPETALTQHIPAVAIMGVVATLTNGIRTQGKAWDKDPGEIFMDSIARMGMNGLPADMFVRGKEAAEIYNNPAAYITGLGPVWGDTFKTVVSFDIASIAGQKIPGYGAFNAIFGATEATEDWPTKYREIFKGWDKAISDTILGNDAEPYRRDFKKGGEVYNVPQVNPEPDERIDKMTGLPYDIQAGGAFIDEEDRQGFALGTLASKAAPVLKSALDEALDVLATKGDNIPLDRLAKGLSKRGVRQDEQDSSGITEMIETEQAMGKDPEYIEAEFFGVATPTDNKFGTFMTTTRKGNLAITPEGLRAFKELRDDKPLIESKFVTAREKYWDQLEEVPPGPPDTISEWIPKEESELVFPHFFEETVPQDTVYDTLETIVFRDPRASTEYKSSYHFKAGKNLNLPKDSPAYQLGLERDPYSYLSLIHI